MQAFPLQWPAGWPRTDHPERSRFDTPMGVARDALLSELRLMGAKDIVVSTNLPIRHDGQPYASAKAPDDSGVVVYFTRNNRQQCIPCDRWDQIKDNIQAIRKTVEALRGLDRWGVRQIVDAAFSGFVALSETVAEDWRSILGLSPKCSSLQEARESYLRRRRGRDVPRRPERVGAGATRAARGPVKVSVRVGRHSEPVTKRLPRRSVLLVSTGGCRLFSCNAEISLPRANIWPSCRALAGAGCFR